MAPYFTNDSCNPFLPQTAGCTLGNYVSYAVNASDAEDFQKTIQFVEKNNIRLTIRNTGHDYNGKATGAGAVALWTNNMKSMKILDYKSSFYTGKAVRMGAGVEVVEAYRFAYEQNLVVVGGNCPTVGMAGGYTQGGGHSPLSSKFGMAADQALEWEVVTATGEHLVASPNQNSDLYWALSGGGGGTYGAVVSLTVKAHPNFVTSAANLTFSSLGIAQDSFWNVVQTFQESLPSIVDTGSVAIFVLTNESFTLMPVQAPGLRKDQLRQLLNPTLNKLKQEKIEYTYNIGEFPTYYDSYRSYDPPWNVSQYQIGGRLIPRSLVEHQAAALVQAERRIINSGIGAIMSGVCLNVSVSNPAINAVNPYWRTALFSAVIGTYSNMSTNTAYAEFMTDQLLPQLENLTPNGAAYVNEANFQQPDFQRVFYGVNYPTLRKIKSKYDPHDMFYAITAVGSEDWYQDESKGGRLCPTP
ncbi:hypothetical protein ACLMJK_002767 [Lecanora helva]